MEFMAIADDLCQLRIAGVLRPKMVDRLRHHQEFQGARYECAVAAMFLRGGFEIKWLTGPGKKCEFVATHAFTGESVAVEAKSRRRSGTLNQSGLPVDPGTLRMDVKHLYDQARAQCQDDMTSVIFIDVNLPWKLGTGSSGVVWEKSVRELMEDYPEPTAESPAIEAGLVFTNFGWHFKGTGRARGMQQVSTFPEHCRKPWSQVGTLIGILQGVQTSGRLPSFGY